MFIPNWQIYYLLHKISTQWHKYNKVKTILIEKCINEINSKWITTSYLPTAGTIVYLFLIIEIDKINVWWLAENKLIKSECGSLCLKANLEVEFLYF